MRRSCSPTGHLHPSASPSVRLAGDLPAPARMDRSIVPGRPRFPPSGRVGAILPGRYDTNAGTTQTGRYHEAMTETGVPVFPPGRYGRRRDSRRRATGLVPLVLAGLGVLIGLLLAVRLYHQYGYRPYHADVTSIAEV